MAVADARVKDASEPYLKNVSSLAHPENVLIALLCSDNRKQRVFVIDKIMTVRAGCEQGSTVVRLFNVPKR